MSDRSLAKKWEKSLFIDFCAAFKTKLFFFYSIVVADFVSGCSEGNLESENLDNQTELLVWHTDCYFIAMSPRKLWGPRHINCCGDDKWSSPVLCCEGESTIKTQQNRRDRTIGSLLMDSQINEASKTAQEKIRSINFTVREKWTELVRKTVETRRRGGWERLMLPNL